MLGVLWLHKGTLCFRASASNEKRVELIRAVEV